MIIQINDDNNTNLTTRAAAVINISKENRLQLILATRESRREEAHCDDRK